MNAIDVEDTISSEFICYYQIDELPGVWTEEALKTDWDERAAESTERLLYRLGKERAGELIDVLNRMRDNPQDPLVQRICSSTLMFWFDDPQYWHAFEALIDRIIANIRAATTTAASEDTHET
jgi:hypothetical protein